MATSIFGLKIDRSIYHENEHLLYLVPITCDFGVVTTINQRWYVRETRDTTRQFRVTKGEDRATSILGLKPHSGGKIN